MKQIRFLFLIFITSNSLAQSGERALGIQSGYDFYSTQEHGWNVGVFGQFQFNENSKWYHEYGIGYVEREYNHPGEVVIDTSGVNYYEFFPYGYSHTVEEYRKEKLFRMQGGVGRMVLNKEKHKLSVGVDLGTSWFLGTKGNGQYLHVEYASVDSTTTVSNANVRAYSFDYSGVQSYSLLEFLPYLNYTVEINDALSFNTRLGGSYPFLSNLKRKPQAQLNLGVYYSF